jgi:telomere length regulation protein
MMKIEIYRRTQSQNPTPKIQTTIQRSSPAKKHPNHCSPPTPNHPSYSRYIRDLLKYLQSDKYEKLHMGLKSAPHLIRQKATFGTELTDQADELARVLTGMQDVFEMGEFQEMRLAGLVALVVAAPERVVGYVVETYFSGDLSIQQRLVLLSALGLGARELADLDKKV